MENITMTNATQTLCARVASPRVGAAHLISGKRGWDQGTTVSTLGHGADGGFAASVTAGIGRPVSYVPTTLPIVMDVAHLRSGRPPV
jgi:hypothetical protein